MTVLMLGMVWPFKSRCAMIYIVTYASPCNHHNLAMVNELINYWQNKVLTWFSRACIIHMLHQRNREEPAMYAKTAAAYLKAFCQVKYSDLPSPETMESIMANGGMMDVFDHKGGGTHKYIPADQLTEQLGMPKGAGVFSYWLMGDGSYLLRTCPGPVAYWSGKPEDSAQWGTL